MINNKLNNNMRNQLNNIDTVEFLPVEVIKPFMSLTVGDILRVNVNTGRYELRSESEDIGPEIYTHEKYEISLEPWLIEKYSDYFQIYTGGDKEMLTKLNTEGKIEPLIPANLANLQKNSNMEMISRAAEDLVGKVESGKEIDVLRKDLDELKEMFNEILESLEE